MDEGAANARWMGCGSRETLFPGDAGKGYDSFRFGRGLGIQKKILHEFHAAPRFRRKREEFYAEGIVARPGDDSRFDLDGLDAIGKGAPQRQSHPAMNLGSGLLNPASAGRKIIHHTRLLPRGPCTSIGRFISTRAFLRFDIRQSFSVSVSCSVRTVLKWRAA